MADVNGMSVRDLRKLIASAGLSHADCLEKADLRDRAREAAALLEKRGGHAEAADSGAGAAAAAKGASSKPSSSSASATQKTVKLGGYDCTLMGSADCLSGKRKSDLCVVILHGFGATSSDFTNVPRMAGALTEGKRVVWCFPQAPVGALGATAWWDIDLMRWMSGYSQGGDVLARMIREEPTGLQSCRERMAKLIDELLASLGGLDVSRLALGGFSQGGITALDVALQMPEGKTVAGVAVLSGATIVVEQWSERLKKHDGLRVFVSHGRRDPVLPFAASGWLTQLLDAGGAAVEYVQHEGGHELGHGTLPRLVSWWAGL